VKEIPAIVARLSDRPDQPHALATLVSVEGSSYRRPGARMLLGVDGWRGGGISGGCLEADVIEQARATLGDGQTRLAVYDTTAENDIVWGLGLGCSGLARVLIERLEGRPAWAAELQRNLSVREPTELAVDWQAGSGRPLGTRLAAEAPDDGRAFRERVLPPPRLLIFGAGDDAQPLARMAIELGWTVVVFDPLPGIASPERFPGAQCIALSSLEAAADAPVDARTCAVIMNHRYLFDLPILRALLPMQLPYLGLLGPKRRAERLLAEIRAEGVIDPSLAKESLRAPVGLDLGGDAPESVALSIVAEIQAVFNGRNARPLRNRDRPIHS
jgi:xanthine dehydrogenase accessory factor